MSPAQAATVYATLRRPAAEDLRRSLPEIGEHLQAAFHELALRPTADGAELLAIELGGAQRAVLRYRECLIAESQGSGS